ncbi:MAG TPA: hypothetical protein VNA15_10720 [Candidatus Angelobacter sp.]|nr:hypothetical protein [Candidatus Angelobacter sp.]
MSVTHQLVNFLVQVRPLASTLLSHLGKEEYQRIKELQSERNKLFDKRGLNVPNLSKTEKDRLMDLAEKAVDAVHELQPRTVPAKDSQVCRTFSDRVRK